MSFGLPFLNCSGLPFWLAQLWFSSDMSLVPQLACAACAFFFREKIKQQMPKNPSKHGALFRPAFRAHFLLPALVKVQFLGPFSGPTF
jgi:hypothetical protein